MKIINTFGPYLGDYRRWLWAQIQAGASLEEAVTDAPEFCAPVVATARRRQQRIDEHQRVLTGVVDARTEKEISR